jgi:predicted AAA+ superfamily ATPase
MKAKKAYLASASFSWFFNDRDIIKLAENVFISVNTDIDFFWRDAYKHEVDFIRVKDNNKIIPIEIKFKDSIDNRDLRNLILFSNKFCLGEGIILSKIQEEKRLSVKEVEIIQRSIYEMI